MPFLAAGMLRLVITKRRTDAADSRCPGGATDRGAAGDQRDTYETPVGRRLFGEAQWRGRTAPLLLVGGSDVSGGVPPAWGVVATCERGGPGDGEPGIPGMTPEKRRASVVRARTWTRRWNEKSRYKWQEDVCEVCTLALSFCANNKAHSEREKTEQGGASSDMPPQTLGALLWPKNWSAIREGRGPQGGEPDTEIL